MCNCIFTKDIFNRTTSVLSLPNIVKKFMIFTISNVEAEVQHDPHNYIIQE